MQADILTMHIEASASSAMLLVVRCIRTWLYACITSAARRRTSGRTPARCAQCTPKLAAAAPAASAGPLDAVGSRLLCRTQR